MPAVSKAALGLELDRAELGRRVRKGLERAERLRRPVLVSTTVDFSPEVDVAATVFHSRSAEERYFVWEQPERERFALGAMGAAWVVEGVPAERRFEEAASRCADLCREAIVPDERAVPA